MKALEALQEICSQYYNGPQYKIIEKEIKALEIIKKKKVDVSFLELGLEQYNNNLPKKHKLSQEEYDLLKEVLL